MCFGKQTDGYFAFAKSDVVCAFAFQCSHAAVGLCAQLTKTNPQVLTLILNTFLL